MSTVNLTTLVAVLVLQAKQLSRKVHGSPFLFTVANIRITGSYPRKWELKGNVRCKAPNFHSRNMVFNGS